MGIIRITDLHVRALIGAHDWERDHQQDLILNIVIEYDSAKASQSDRLNDALDYEALVKDITTCVKKSQCYLLEKLGALVLKLILKNKSVIHASVRIDKPQAIAEAKSVSFELYGTQTR